MAELAASSPFTRPDALIHIVGIGGAGMSAIARVLLESGIRVSGSDRQKNDFTHALARDGATIVIGHDASHVQQATCVLISSAVKDDNPEVMAARRAHIPVFTRREAFPYLLPGKTQIAIAGTHGKTTTTALVVHLLRETGHDPSYIVGGVLNNTGTNAHAGRGSAFVVEADEYGDMFLGLSPRFAVITNIEHDHPDMFPTIDDVFRAFRKFIAILPDDGTLITWIENPHVYLLALERKAAGKPTVTYALDNPNVDWMASDPINHMTETEFTIRRFLQGRQPVQQAVISPLAGQHNVLNVLAALAAVDAYGVPLEQAAPHVATFKGTGRRFELMGQAGGVTVISDYAHHPTAIRATLQAARQRYGNTTIWAVWQPHTYSRTRVLGSEFARAFKNANYLFITDIFAARETAGKDDPTAFDLARMAVAAGHSDARHSGNLDETAAILAGEVQSGDIVIIFSAGDAPRIGEKLLEILASR